MIRKADARSIPDIVLDAVYVKAQEDLILIPLRWRACIAVIFAIMFFCGLVLYPIDTILNVDYYSKVYPEDVAFIAVGLFLSCLCLYSAGKAFSIARLRDRLRQSHEIQAEKWRDLVEPGALEEVARLEALEEDSKE